MVSAQTLSDADRRLVALWAADCAERVLPVFEAEAPDDTRARDGILRARAFGRGELDAAGQILRRFEAGRAAQSLMGEDPAGPLGQGLLTRGQLAVTIREIQAALR